MDLLLVLLLELLLELLLVLLLLLLLYVLTIRRRNNTGGPLGAPYIYIIRCIQLQQKQQHQQQLRQQL